MPFTTEQISYAGKAAINFFLKNDPVDQINVAHPLLKRLMDEKQAYAGALQYVVEQLRYQNDSNFQSYFGDQQVSYNRKRTLNQAQYQWGSFHDGFGLNEDELAQNGILVTDDKEATQSDAEKIQLTNLLEENTSALKLGFQENFDYMAHRDGTASTTDIPGLDNLIATDPTASTVIGGINQNTNLWWRNNASTGISTGTAGNLVEQMEVQWRACTRYGGFAPNFIIAGSKFIDAYRVDAKATVNRRLETPQKGGVGFDASVSGIYFKGIEILWDPVMDALQALDNPTINWDKRCYFLNTKFMRLRPIAGHWMISRRPPRVYDRYTNYWGLTAKAALTTNKRNAHSVLSIA